MFEIFESYLKSKGEFSRAEIDLIRAAAIIKTLQPKSYFIKSGELMQYYAFICKGCLRNYVSNPNGTEKTMTFTVENWWAGDRESLSKGTPSATTAEVLEETLLIMFEKDTFAELARQIPALAEMMDTLFHRSYVSAFKRVHEAIAHTDEEKYQNFTSQYPELVNRIPLDMIASYTDIKIDILEKLRLNQ